MISHRFPLLEVPGQQVRGLDGGPHAALGLRGHAGTQNTIT